MEGDEPRPPSPAQVERLRRAIRRALLRELSRPRGPDGSGPPPRSQ